MPRVSEQVEWLSLVDISGPFLVPAVLEQVFPQGLEKVETPRRQRIRSAYEEWRDAVDDDDPQLREMHTAWVLMVLQDMLEYEDEVLVPQKSLDGECVYRAPEHGVEYTPDYAVRGADGKLRLLIAIWPPETDLEKAPSGDSWTASPLERMTLLCRATVTRLGLVTDGERWMLVNAPVGATSGYAAWLARLWWQEPVTLKAFQSLLGVRRFFGPKEETLEALLEKSAEFQEEVTDTLGEQVRRAVEILVQSLGRADQDRNGELLKDVRPAELYEAGLTVMMRMVFTLCAEERGLLLLGDPVYDQHYALSTLRARLREDADRYGVEVLERRHDAWSRMLAVFRAIYGGVEHESLRMPALGGSLFDPDRFPLLEGRAKGTSWRDTPSVPLPIDNRTVLLLLDALQVLDQKGGARLLSYRALDVEQIGHVYEGLLEYTIARLDEVTVGLIGSQKARHPSIALAELESLKAGGTEKAVESLAETTGRSPAAIRRALERQADDETLVRLVHACGGDEKLARRLLPFADLIREDSWGTLVVYKPGSFAVVHGSDRRETGTHYTPRSLTESIVEKTLEPVVYSGPAEGEPRERWKLKTPAEILDLKVCDPAMGSGAFLVQVCRDLAERLVEAWAREEAAGKAVTADGVVLDALGQADPLPKSLDERLVVARRLIAERCLYGVDINPLAVELAKLSIWLVTMAKGRPFGFLDHNLRSGDSLLGIHRLDQLTKLHWESDSEHCQPRLFGRSIEDVVRKTSDVRNQMRSLPIRDIRDVDAMMRMDASARDSTRQAHLYADALLAVTLCSSQNCYEQDLNQLAIDIDAATTDPHRVLQNILAVSQRVRNGTRSGWKPRRHPFHWPLCFPEAMQSGFDAIVGNPPFMGGKQMPTFLGPDYCEALKRTFSHSKGAGDLVAYFYRRAYSLLRCGGAMGLLATKSISETATRVVGLDPIIAAGGSIYCADTMIPWPGRAAVVVSRVHIFKGQWRGECRLNGFIKCRISSSLHPSLDFASAVRLDHGIDYAQGTTIYGKAFIRSADSIKELLAANPGLKPYLRPYINGDVLNGSPNLTSGLVAIDFGDRDEADICGCDAIIKELKKEVSRERANQKRQIHEHRPWLHWDKRLSFFKKARRLPRILACVIVQRHLAFVFVDPNHLFAHGIKLFADTRGSLFAALQSTIHEIWVQGISSKLGKSNRYSTSSSFDTFPLTEKLLNSSHLSAVGDRYHEIRAAIMLKREVGLTQCYNQMHDPDIVDSEMEKLRQAHAAMSHSVAACFGWGDIDLKYGFYDTQDGVRFTIDESAKHALLEQLLELNHDLAAKGKLAAANGDDE